MDGTYMSNGEVAAAQVGGKLDRLERRVVVLEQAVAELVKRASELDMRTASMVRLGPRPDDPSPYDLSRVIVKR